MKKLKNGVEVEAEGCDWGVQYDDGFVVLCDGAGDAYLTADATGGTVVARDVWVSAWAVVDD